MTDYHDVRDALCKLRERAYGNVGMGGNGQRLLTDSAAFSLAPIFVRALRAERTAGYLAGFRCADDGGLGDQTGREMAEAAGKGELTAGIRAMVEDS